MREKSKLVSWGLSIVFLLLTTGVVFADNGLYLEASAGRTMVDDDFAELPIEDEATSVRLGVGFGIAENIAIEASFVNLGEFVADFDGIEGEVEGGALSGVFSMPVSDNLLAYARIGMFFWESTISDFNVSFTEEGEDLFYGVGLEAVLSKQFSITGEWDRYEFFDADADVLSVGFKYRF